VKEAKGSEEEEGDEEVIDGGGGGENSSPFVSGDAGNKEGVDVLLLPLPGVVLNEDE
jgi:hypothetical protein